MRQWSSRLITIGRTKNILCKNIVHESTPPTIVGESLEGVPQLSLNPGRLTISGIETDKINFGGNVSFDDDGNLVIFQVVDQSQQINGDSVSFLTDDE
ncbi:MAG: hypothetical protein ABSB19_07090 [Methylomonas sp.]|jgi:hypothetical protein